MLLESKDCRLKYLDFVVSNEKFVTSYIYYVLAHFESTHDFVGLAIICVMYRPRRSYFGQWKGSCTNWKSDSHAPISFILDRSAK